MSNINWPVITIWAIVIITAILITAGLVPGWLVWVIVLSAAVLTWTKE